MGEINFKEERNGYDKGEVDSYIKKVSDAYQRAYGEYLNTVEKYNRLMEEHKKLESEKRSVQGSDAEVIAKTLISSERLAKEIIENAREEESRIVDMTVQNIVYAYKTLENAMGEIQKFLAFNNSTMDEMKESGGVKNGIEVDR